MAGHIAINLPNTIESITILDDCHAPVRADTKSGQRGNDLNSQIEQKELLYACTALNTAAEKIHELYEKIIIQKKEEIAKLSIEIARKILKYKIETNDYEIESIILEALRNCPSTHDIILHLNPKDFEQCQKIQEKNNNGILAAVKLVADPNVERAEFILKSPKGTILSQINEQLKQIGDALGKVK
jgi:flagellar biosynthesis/type III secretory pathway protein FliH